MHEEAKEFYNPHEVSPFVYANHVVAAIEAEDGKIYIGFCFAPTAWGLLEVADKINEVDINKCGVFHLFAERAAAFNMYQYSGQTKMKRVLAFRDKPSYGGGSGMPCGACREFLMELNLENRHLEFMLDFEKRETITLGELMPYWWGQERTENDGKWYETLLLYVRIIYKAPPNNESSKNQDVKIAKKVSFSNTIDIL